MQLPQDSRMPGYTHKNSGAEQIMVLHLEQIHDVIYAPLVKEPKHNPHRFLGLLEHKYPYILFIKKYFIIFIGILSSKEIIY